MGRGKGQKDSKPRRRRTQFALAQAAYDAEHQEEKKKTSEFMRNYRAERESSAGVSRHRLEKGAELVKLPSDPVEYLALDVDSLSKEQILEILPPLTAYLKAKSSRLVERIVIQNHQIPIVASQKKQVTISGGNQSGKTFLMCYIVACYLKKVSYFVAEAQDGRIISIPFPQIPKHPLHIRYSTVDYELFDSVIIPYFNEMFDHRNLRRGVWAYAVQKKQGYVSKINSRDGGWVELKTYNQDVQSFQAGQLDLSVMDEPCPDRDKYQENWMRTTIRRGRLINGFTVWSKYGSITWERELLDKAMRQETESLYDFFEMSLLDNKYIPEESKIEIAAGLTPDEYGARVLGKALHMSDLVYHRFKPEINIVPDFALPPHWPRIIIVDPHPDKAHAVDWFAVSEDDDIYWYRSIKKKGVVPELVSEIRVLTGSEPVALYLIDPSSNQKSENRGVQTFKFQFIEAGLHHLIDGEVRNEQANILKVNELLTADSISQNPRIHIFESLKTDPRDKDNWGPLNEIENYVYVTSRMAEQTRDTKKPRDKWNDHMVNLRMLVATNPHFSNLIPLRHDTAKRWDQLNRPQYDQIDEPDDKLYHGQLFSRPSISHVLGDYDG